MRPGVTPVLIPNTMVKTRTADGTALETMWESRWLPRLNGGVAQLGEHLPCKQGVMSSNLTISTKVMKRMSGAYGQSRANAYMQTSPGMYGRKGIRRIPVMNKREAVVNPADM